MACKVRNCSDTSSEGQWVDVTPPRGAAAGVAVCDTHHTMIRNGSPWMVRATSTGDREILLGADFPPQLIDYRITEGARNNLSAINLIALDIRRVDGSSEVVEFVVDGAVDDLDATLRALLGGPTL